MENSERCVVGVFNRDISHVLDYAFALVGHERGSGLNAVALLLASAELAILVAEDDWCLIEDKSVTIETLRRKAVDSASRVFLQFKHYEAS